MKIANQVTTNNDISYLRILLVDDEEFILDLSSRILRSLGCENFETAGNGKQAIEKLTREGEPFDIVISDLTMPDMDGFEFMHQVAEWDITCGLIVLSGEDRDTLNRAKKIFRSMKLNILGVIQKPLTSYGLKNLLKKFITK